MRPRSTGEWGTSRCAVLGPGEDERSMRTQKSARIEARASSGLLRGKAGESETTLKHVVLSGGFCTSNVRTRVRVCGEEMGGLPRTCTRTWKSFCGDTHAWRSDLGERGVETASEHARSVMREATHATTPSDGSVVFGPWAFSLFGAGFRFRNHPRPMASANRTAGAQWRVKTQPSFLLRFLPSCLPAGFRQ